MSPHKRFAGAAGALRLAAVSAAALYLAARPEGRAADKSDPPKAAAALEYVPADAVLVVTGRVGELWNHPLAKAGRTALGNHLADALEGFRKQFGVAPDEIDRLTAFYTSAAFGTSPPLMVVTTVKPYNRKAILDAAAPGAKEEKINNWSVYSNEEKGPSFAFLDDRTFFVHPERDAVPSYLRFRGDLKDEGPPKDVKEAAEKHCLVAWANVAKMDLALLHDDQLPPSLQPFKALQKTQTAMLTVDLDEQLRADLKLTFANEADAKAGAAAVNDALDLARGALPQAIEQLNKLADAPKTTALLKDVQAALRAAKAEQKGSTVEATAAMKIDPEATAAALAEAVEKVQAAAHRMRMSNDLKQLAIAVQSYHDVNGAFPQPAIYDKNGKPLLSWRVMVLPYVEQGALYSEFHLDEPWDSENNKKLLDKMPTIFAPPESEAFKKHEAVYQALVGKGTPFEGKDLKATMAMITSQNGASNTIMFVEAAKGVPWTKPEDISLDAGKLVPKLGGLNKGGFLVSFCDGSVRFLPLTVDEKDLRRAATYTNTEPFTLPDK